MHENLKSEFDLINKDRIDKIAEIEQKNREILEFRSKIHKMESNIALAELTHKALTEKYSILESQNKDLVRIDFREKKELKDENKFLKNKLDIMDNTLLNMENFKTDENYRMRSVYVFTEMLKDFKHTLANILEKSKIENSKLEFKIQQVLEKKSAEITDIITFFKENENSLKKSLDTLLYKTNYSTNNEITDWLQNQINDLLPYKHKYKSLDIEVGSLKNEIELQRKKVFVIEEDNSALKILLRERQTKIEKLTRSIVHLEDKISDLKDVIFKNLPANKYEDILIRIN